MVQVVDMAADGGLAEADGGGEGAHRDAAAAVGGEDGCGGFQEVRAALAVPLGGAGAGWAGFYLGAHEAGGDGGHGAGG